MNSAFANSSIFFRVNFNASENEVIHFLRSYRALGRQFLDSGFKGIDVMKRMGAFHNLQIGVLRSDGFSKFLQKRANLNQARGQMQGLDPIFLQRPDFLLDAVCSEGRRTSAATDNADQLRWIVFRIAFKHPLSAPQITETADHHTVHIPGSGFTT